MRNKKIAIIGAGNAGCLTALHYYYWSRNDLDKITIYHDPTVPIEKVGQGTAIKVTELIFNTLNIDFIENNPIKATIKHGIMYENWGKRNVFHNFPFHYVGCHYVPHLLSNVILNSDLFEVVEKKINDPEKEIDADYIFDCRGKTSRGFKDTSTKLINPLNSVLVSRKPGRDLNLTYTRCVATPDGWTFVIPNHDSVSYGYLYNNKITKIEDAKNNFSNMFDVTPDFEFQFDNYIEKSMWYGKRTILNGNRFSFLEPLEATSTGFYLDLARESWDHIFNGKSKEECNSNIQKEMKKIETFVLWHYQAGSKFNTPFWEYTKQLKFYTDKTFDYLLDFSMNNDHIEQWKFPGDYSQWSPYSFNKWSKVF